METIVPVIVGLILIAMTYFLMSKKDTKSQIISLEDCDISKLEIKKKSVFYIGISDQAISVSENGILRGIEFSRDLYKVLKKAIAYPRSGDSYLPETVCFVNSSAAFEKDINQITKLGITIGNYKDFEVKAKRPTDAGQTASTGLLPQPNRGCFVCHKEIESKPSQCSACKAVIYCGGACAKKDWPSHKQICGNFKTSVEHIKEWDLHDFPFDFYNKDKILCNYNAVPLLNTQGKHNLGLFSRLCGCFTDIPWGELGKDILEKCQESGDPQKMFQLLGLDAELFPLSKPLSAEYKLSEIDSWEKYYKARGLSMNNLAAFVLEVPLTITYMVNKFLPSQDSEDDSSNKKRKLTIHLVGVEKEADMFPLFECMLALFPKTDICIHMVGLSVSTKIPMEQSSVLIRSAANESSILITLTAAMYGPQHIDGTAFQLPPEMPEEMKNEMNFGQGKPDILIALNASLVAQDEWGSILTCLADTDVKFLVTEQIEQMCLAAISVLPSVGLKSIIDIQPNPFRQPLYGFKKDINLPSWSNAFIFGIGI